MRPLYTIGHSRHSMEQFVELLRRHGVARVVDVRSFPSSRMAPQFNRPQLEAALGAAGIAYEWRGAELGGRGREAYDVIRRKPGFQQAVRELIVGSQEQPTAMMCAEEDPFTCHRRILITRSLLEDFSFLAVEHIRKDGQAQPEPGFPDSAVQLGLGF